MDSHTFFELVTQLRDAQKAYFNCSHTDKEKKQSLLRSVKYHENRVDNIIKATRDEMQGMTLFSQK